MRLNHNLATSSINPYTADYRGWSWVARRYWGKRVNTVLPGKRSAAAGHFVPFALLTVGLAGLLVGCGWAIVAGDAKVLFIGLAVVAAVVWWNRGVLTGIFVLLLLEGVPFINPGGGSSTIAGANAPSDVVFVALVVLLALCAFDGTGNRAQNRIAILASTWASCYFAWWLYKVVAASPGIPVLSAFSFGREYFGFSLFLPLALLALRRRQDLVGFAITLAIGGAIFSAGQILVQVAHVELPGLIHIIKTNEFEGLTRIYSDMNELLAAVFPMALAATLLGPKPWRRRALPLAVLTGLANALTFTRAVYASELLALLLISLIWARGAGWRPRRVRRMFAFAVVATMFAIAFAGGSSTTSGNSSSPVQAVIARAELGLSNAQNKTGTLAVREHEADRDLEVLGDRWVTGLGFLNPAYHYVLSLHHGSIRNSDVGSLNIVMTMGLIGLILAYIPPVAALIYLLRRRYSWIQYGGAMYLGAALIASITLGTVASLAGLLTVGSVLVLCLNWTALEEATV